MIVFLIQYKWTDMIYFIVEKIIILLWKIAGMKILYFFSPSLSLLQMQKSFPISYLIPESKCQHNALSLSPISRYLPVGIR